MQGDRRDQSYTQLQSSADTSTLYLYSLFTGLSFASKQTFEPGGSLAPVHGFAQLNHQVLTFAIDAFDGMIILSSLPNFESITWLRTREIIVYIVYIVYIRHALWCLALESMPPKWWLCYTLAWLISIYSFGQFLSNQTYAFHGFKGLELYPLGFILVARIRTGRGYHLFMDRDQSPSIDISRQIISTDGILIPFGHLKASAILWVYHLVEASNYGEVLSFTFLFECLR